VEGNHRVSRRPHLPLTPLVVGAALLLMTYLGFTTAQYVLHDRDLRQQESQLHTDIAQLDRDHDQLVAVRDYLKSDEYVEEIARKVLGLVRPGETLVIVSSDAVPTPKPTANPERTPTDWWKELFAPTPAPSN
jgi:cell division protein FtsB